MSKKQTEDLMDLPEPSAWRYKDSQGNFRFRGKRVGFDKEYACLKPEGLYTATLVRAMLSTLTEGAIEKAAKYDRLQPYLCKTCSGYGLVDRRCFDDPLGSEACPDCNRTETLELNASQVEAAARKLAEVFDYPWEYMPEEGRENMRKNVRSVLAATKEGAT